MSPTSKQGREQEEKQGREQERASMNRTITRETGTRETGTKETGITCRHCGEPLSTAEIIQYGGERCEDCWVRTPARYGKRVYRCGVSREESRLGNRQGGRSGNRPGGKVGYLHAS